MSICDEHMWAMPQISLSVTAEIVDRKKQYSYYLDKLLNFTEKQD